MNETYTLKWIGDRMGHLRLLDQTLLPNQVEYRDCHSVEEVWEAIKTLRVRGAPAIGIAAAMGVVIGLQQHTECSPLAPRVEGVTADTARLPGAIGSRSEPTTLPAFQQILKQVADYLRTSRPTAVNLFWAIERMQARAQNEANRPPDEIHHALLQEALKIQEEDRAMCRAIGAHGARLIESGQGVLTHCNAGGLATAEYGTALAVMYAAAAEGKRFQVYADETRPLWQGARLTAWELTQHGIDVTLICDSMAAQVMKEGRVHLVVTGADRIAANGDAANKIGTYGVALLAMAHGIPFYVAAPSSTFDLRLPDGSAIPIEQRDPREVTHPMGRAVAPEGVKVYNPAFDVTPAHLIRGLITEKGVIQPVTAQRIREVIGSPTR